MSTVSKQLAALILKAHDLHEKSYDAKTARDYLAGEPVPAAVFPALTRGDFSVLYNKDIYQAIAEACENEQSMLPIIQILLSNNANYAAVVNWAENA